MMVPMADVLNHVAKNNAKLKFGKDALKMVACQPIKQVWDHLKFLGTFSFDTPTIAWAFIAVPWIIFPGSKIYVSFLCLKKRTVLFTLLLEDLF